jgi:hypothetical protein
MMNANIGTTDRVLRILVGLAALGAGYYYGSWWGAVGLIPLVTAFVRWCPLYAPFGISTCSVPQAKQ